MNRGSVPDNPKERESASAGPARTPFVRTSPPADPRGESDTSPDVLYRNASEEQLLKWVAASGVVMHRDAFVERAQRHLSELTLIESCLSGSTGVVAMDAERLNRTVRELWRRWLPDRPSIERTSGRIDQLIDGLFTAAVEDEFAHKIATLDEVVDVLSAAAAAWNRPCGEIHSRSAEVAVYDWDATIAEVMDELPEPQCAEDKCRLAERWYQMTESADWAETYARSLIVAGRVDEAERLYDTIRRRALHPFWLHIVAGDAYIDLYRERLDRRWLLRAVHHLARAGSTGDGDGATSADSVYPVDRHLVELRLTDIQRKLREHAIEDDCADEAAALNRLAKELRDRHAESDS